MPNHKLSVILPTFNESGNIIPLVNEISQKLKYISHEIIIVDDNSPDKTGFTAKKHFSKRNNIRVFIRNKRGLAGAILFGINKSKNNFLCIMDTDFNHDPKELPKMYKLLKSADIVIGSRYVKGGGMANRPRHYLSRIYNRAIGFILKLPTHDNLSGFFMINKSKPDKLFTPNIFFGYGDYFIRLLFKAHEEKLRIIEIPVFYKNRIRGESKSIFFKMFIDYSRTVIDIIRNK